MKRLFSLLMAMAFTLSLCACGLETSNTAIDQTHTTKDVTVTEAPQKTEETVPGQILYESEGLRVT